jgi:hypothetical protein
MCAFAEAAWSSGPRELADFRERLAAQAPLLVSVGALGSNRLGELGAAGPGDAVGVSGEAARPARIEG